MIGKSDEFTVLQNVSDYWQFCQYLGVYYQIKRTCREYFANPFSDWYIIKLIYFTIGYSHINIGIE